MKYICVKMQKKYVFEHEYHVHHIDNIGMYSIQNYLKSVLYFIA